MPSLARVLVLHAVLSPGLASASGIAGGTPPKHEDYQASPYAGKPKEVVLATSSDRLFRTRLREASKEQINFAGEYVLTYWGCGCCCISVAAINQRTGRVLHLPGQIVQPFHDIKEDRLQFNKNSKLLQVMGEIDQDGEQNGFGRHFFVMTEKGFKKVHFLPLPKLTDEAVRQRIRKGFEEDMP